MVRWAPGWASCGQHGEAPSTEQRAHSSDSLGVHLLPAQDLHLGSESFFSGTQISFQITCSNGRYSNLWLILRAVKTKLFSIALITLAYGARGGTDKGGKGTRGPEKDLIPTITASCRHHPVPQLFPPLPLDLPVSRMLSSEFAGS